MKKIFWQDPYQTELTTTVVSVEGTQVVFAETIAYSFAGGQESDKASVNGIPIIHSTMEGHLIRYQLPEQHGLVVGDTVLMIIDWNRRLKLMRLHFAAELILELVTQQYGFEKVGAHISESKSRIDFKSETSVAPLLPLLLEKYEAIIKADLPICKGYSDEVNQRRFWKIDGFAQVPCGGTHVRSTAEVGFVMLKREKPGKGLERIEIRLQAP